MSSQSKALVLDFGGVVTRTLFETHDLTEQALGLPSGSLTWRGPFDPASDPLWQSMQDDQISERDYWHARTREVAGQVGADWSQMSDFVKAARGADPEPVMRPERGSSNVKYGAPPRNHCRVDGSKFFGATAA